VECPLGSERPTRASLAAAVAVVLGWVLAWTGALPFAQAAGPLSIESSDGEHTLALGLSTRLRAEGWDSRANNTDWFTAVRTRVGLRYAFKQSFVGFAEFQDARIHGLDPDATGGAGGLYFVHNGREEENHGDRIRQLFIEVRPIEPLRVRAGRQDIKGGLEVKYPEANWKYLKGARLSQRLVGTVGWTHGERSNDGVVMAYDMGDLHLHLFGAKPTTGVFDLNSGYSSQNDILYGGVTLTAKRGAWMNNTEVRLFGLAYRDDRDAPDGGLMVNDDLDVFTAGFSLLRIHPVGAGSYDVLLWGAYQWGDWYGSDHSAWAGIFETGYQFTEAAMKPWLRVGVNIASGDRSSTDGDHQSFFNMLPTNHLYYGFADQFAFSNLVNYFAQLKLSPLPKTGLNLFLHHFTLLTDDDSQYRGTGAFNRNAFGYPGRASGGHRGLGTEVDVVLTYKLHERVSLLAGYSFMEGHGLFNDPLTKAGATGNDDDTRFAYFQVSAKY
jgi:hypothetical protein